MAGRPVPRGHLESFEVPFKDPATGEIRVSRRPLDPGAKVYGADYGFLRDFYQFSESSSIHIGNLVGCAAGPEAVPTYLDVSALATEHLAVLAMTGSGKSYTVGRVIERLVAHMNGTVVVFDPRASAAAPSRAGSGVQTRASDTATTHGNRRRCRG